MDLDIHLDSGNAIVCSGYLKVHISKKVFQSLDIGKYDIIIVCVAGYETAGNTRNLFFDRHSGCHKRHGGSTDTCL